MERLSMRQIRELLRLRYALGLTARQVAKSLNLARSTVGKYERRFNESGLGWPLPRVSDSELEHRLFPPRPAMPTDQRTLPDWGAIQRELRRPGVTLFLLWQEYKAQHPDGFQYSWFCDHYRAWHGTLSLVMRQTHRAGEKLFVDYAGQTVNVVDRTTGEVHTAQIFVAVLGASSYTFAEATWTQQLPDWIGSHVRAFAFFGGVSEVIVPDNLKSAVQRAHRYEPDLNPTYVDMARHYGTTVLPARARKPKDKAKVEAGVQVVERWILAVLRNRTFFSLSEVNQAIAELRERLNQRPFKKLPSSRREQFEALDRPALRPLPATPYVFAEWKKARVHIDYHVEVKGHYYSVPHALVKQELDVRLTANTVECFHRSVRVASHVRSSLTGRHTTIPEHMPPSHRAHAEWTPERLIRWAEQTGPATAGVIQQVLHRRRHPQQGFRSALGILRLGKGYGDERLEAACRQALALGTCRYKSIESILRNGLDRDTPAQPAPELDLEHANLRGARYYH